MWAAEPKMMARKSAGLTAVLFLAAADRAALVHQQEDLGPAQGQARLSRRERRARRPPRRSSPASSRSCPTPAPRPPLVETADGARRVMKFAGAGPGPFGLLTEFLALGIARALGAPVPAAEPIFLPRGLPLAGRHRRVRRDAPAQQRLEPRHRLARRRPPGHRRRPRAPPPADALDAIARADALLQNVDRTARNPNLLVAARPALGDRLRRLPLPLPRPRPAAPPRPRCPPATSSPAASPTARCRPSTSPRSSPRRRRTGSPPPAPTAPASTRRRSSRYVAAWDRSAEVGAQLRRRVGEERLGRPRRVGAVAVDEHRQPGDPPGVLRLVGGDDERRCRARRGSARRGPASRRGAPARAPRRARPAAGAAGRAAARAPAPPAGAAPPESCPGRRCPSPSRPDVRQRRLDPRPARAVEPQVGAEAEADVRRRGQVREEVVLLEEQRQRPLRRRQRGDVPPVPEDAPARRRDEAGDGVEERALARPRRADQRGRAARPASARSAVIRQSSWTISTPSSASIEPPPAVEDPEERDRSAPPAPAPPRRPPRSGRPPSAAASAAAASSAPAARRAR